MKHALFALALIAATPSFAQDARLLNLLPATADQWGCPAKGHFHYCSRDNAATLRMQCPYGCNYTVIGDDLFEDAADGYIYVPRDLVAQTKGLREYP